MGAFFSARLLFAFVLLSSGISLGAIVFPNLDALPSDIRYDFIVAGGGTAGSLVASRLAENPHWKVLIVEAGGSNDEFWEIRVPGLWSMLQNTRLTWNYTTVPQSGLNNRPMAYAAGKVLGGASSINGIALARGSKSEWNQYAEVGGTEGLRWENILSLFIKAENFTHGRQKYKDAGHYDPAFHGTKGQLFTQAPYSEHPFNDMLVRSSEELSQEFPLNCDWNGGNPVGTGWNQYSIDLNSERSSATTAFLSHTGKNVHILLNTQVTRVIPVRPDSTEFRVVEVGSGATTKLRWIVAGKEVILSGGVFGTPQILLHSGIGKQEELEAVGVKPLVDNPSVGKNLTDTVAVLTSFAANLQQTTFDQEAALREWNATRTGPLAQPLQLNHMSFIRLPDNTPPFTKEGFCDPSPAKDTAHVQLRFISIDGPHPDAPGTNSTLQVYIVNLHPASRGSVTLSSSNPFQHSAIDVGLLAEYMDMSIMREGVRSLRKLLSAPVFRDSVFGSVVPAANVTTDEDLENFLRSTGTTWTHGVGTASMSPEDAGWGVVDPDFRVKGTSGLRVVDASVIPFLPSGHTMMTVYGFAEWASVVIARSYSGSQLSWLNVILSNRLINLLVSFVRLPFL